MRDLTDPPAQARLEGEPGDSLCPTLTRRRLVRGAAAGAGLIALGEATAGQAIDTLSQIDGTPPAAPGLPPVGGEGESVADRAFVLDNDIDRIFRFLAGEIRYEGYDGALRGAQGALWARAGNSVDRATLLLELLTVSQIPCRLAFGALTPEGETQLAALMPGGSAARAAWDAALLGAVEPVASPDATPVALTPEQREVVDLVMQQAAALQDRAAALVDVSTPLIADALDAAGVPLPELPSSPVTALERSRHAWVQVADGPDWRDLDPSVPDAEPGETFADLETTAAELPENLHHRIRIALAVEEVSGGALARREVLSYESPSQRFLNTPIALTMTGRDDLGDVGMAITDVFSGTVSLIPCLVAGDDVVTATTPVVFGSGGGGVVGVLDDTAAEGPADGETLAVWLVVDVTDPAGVTVTIERALLDRFGYAARAAGTVDLAAVTPATLVADANGATTVADLTIIDVELARLPSLYATRDARSAELLGDLHLFGSSFASLRASLGFEHEGPAGFQSFPNAPCLTALSVRLVDPADEGAGIEIASDLLLQRRALVPFPDGTSGSASSHILAGVLDQVAEQVLVEPLVPTVGSANVVAPTVGMVFAGAERDGIGIVAVTTPDDLAGLTHGEDALARMRTAVEGGLVAVVPETAVEVGGEAVSGWWLVDPVTGHVRDEMENGRGYAGGVFARQQGGYAGLLNNIRTWAAPYTALGRCLAIVAAAAVRASDYSGSQDLVNAGIETFKNLDPSATKGCFG